MENKRTYSVYCQCNNCGWQGPIYFDFETTADTGDRVCPNCGLKYLVKSWTQPQPTIYPIPTYPDYPLPNQYPLKPWDYYDVSFM